MVDDFQQIQPNRYPFELVFRPASELPTADLHGRAVIVYNPCDGWHEAKIHASEDGGEIYHVGIYQWLMKEITPHDFYIAWALLPLMDDMHDKFISEKRCW